MTTRNSIFSLCLAVGVGLGAVGACAEPELEVGTKPFSLIGTDTDGVLVADGAGEFVADDRAIALFDYYLTTEGEADGEVDAAAIHEMIAGEIAGSLTGAARDQALDAMSDYLTYRAELAAELSDPEITPEQARQRMRAIHAATVADIPALADDPQRFDRALAIRAALTDPGLDRAARRARLAEIERTMTPPDQLRADREARRASLRALSLRAEERALRASGGGVDDDDAAIRALRVERVGAAAADRLAALDAKRAAWQARVSAYRTERARLETELAAAPKAERQRALTALRRARFDSREQRRIAALGD